MQGRILTAIPVLIPVCSATIPMIQGMMMAPLLATAVGFIPAIEKAKAKSNSIAAFWEWESMSPI